MGMAFFSQGAMANDEDAALDEAFTNLDEIQSKLSDCKDTELQNLAPIVSRVIDSLAGIHGGGHGGPGHPGPRPGPYPGPHPGPRPGYDRFYCIAVDRGFEEHRGGHYGDGYDVRRAESEAMGTCLRYHGSCRIKECGRR